MNSAAALTALTQKEFSVKQKEGRPNICAQRERGSTRVKWVFFLALVRGKKCQWSPNEEEEEEEKKKGDTMREDTTNRGAPNIG